MARDGVDPLPENMPEPLTPELAPFVALARARFEQATDGLDHEAAVEHLEAALAQATIAGPPGPPCPGPPPPPPGSGSSSPPPSPRTPTAWRSVTGRSSSSSGWATRAP